LSSNPRDREEYLNGDEDYPRIERHSQQHNEEKKDVEFPTHQLDSLLLTEETRT
jgi:hypothetical protein